jgi:hypothetical protein
MLEGVLIPFVTVIILIAATAVVIFSDNGKKKG